MPGPNDIRAGGAFVEAYLEDNKLQRGLRAVQTKLRNFGRSVNALGSQFLALGTGIAAPLGLAVKAASDAQESLSRFEQVFGVQAAAAGRFADELADAVGRSKTEIKDALATFQGFFVGLGFSPAESRQLSQQLEELAIDFASFNNLSDQEAVERFISALSGSSEVLDRFGINIKAAALGQELLRQGIEKTAAQASEQEKAIARLQIILRAMTDQGAVGDAVRTSGSLANQMKRARAELQETAVAVGTALIPAVTELLQSLTPMLQDWAEWAQQNPQLIVDLGKLAAVLVVAGAGLKALSVVSGVLNTALTGLSVALRVANGAAAAFAALLASNPLLLGLGLIATGIGLVVASTTEWTSATERAVAEQREMVGLLQAQEDRLRDQTRELQHLADQERLSNEEKARAKQLIASLTAQYGDLGITLDETTGQIVAMSGAFQGLNVKLLETELKRVTAELGLAKSEAQLAQEQIADLGTRGVYGRLFEDVGILDPAAEANRAEIIAARGRLLDAQKQVDDFEQRIKQLQGQIESGGEPGEPAEPAAGEPDLTGLRDFDILALNERFFRERQQQVQRLQDAEEDAARRIAELRVRATKEGLDEELALLELRREEAIREARAIERDVAQVNEEFDLEERLIRQAHEARDVANKIKTDLQGAFSAGGKQRLGTGGGELLNLNREQLREQNAMRRALERLERRAQHGAQFA